MPIHPPARLGGLCRDGLPHPWPLLVGAPSMTAELARLSGEHPLCIPCAYGVLTLTLPRMEWTTGQVNQTHPQQQGWKFRPGSIRARRACESTVNPLIIQHYIDM